jgi:NAD(P)-dependent dehydrogenase (short-subunit alcohol dehydrogenase family)
MCVDDSAGPGWSDPVDSRIPAHRPAHVVAGAVSYLVSDDAGFVSGQRIVVNGGFHFI